MTTLSYNNNVSSVIALKNESKRRLDKLHAKCIEKAKSKKSFDRSFVIESDHIIKRGTDQNSSLRSAIQNEHKASLIIHGRINYPTSNDTHPMEIAIDGWFRDFKYIEFGTTAKTVEITINRLQVRLVIRDKITKLIIVTVHPNQGVIDKTIPEVPNEVW